MKYFLHTALVALFLFALGTPISRAETAETIEEKSYDEILLDALMERGLYRLAELHCKQRLASPSLPPEARAELTCEKLRMLATRAILAPQKEKEALFEEYHAIYNEYIRLHPDSVWQPLLDYQYSLGLFAQAQQSALEGAVAGETSHAMIQARELLRRCLALLDEVEKEVQRLSLEAARLKPSQKKKKSAAAAGSRGRFSPSGLSEGELIALGRKIAFQRARAFMQQAQTYPLKSPDRVNSAALAQAAIETLYDVPNSDPLYWEARLAEVESFLLMEDVAKAELRVQILEKKAAEINPEEIVYLKLYAMKMKVFVAKKSLDEALEFVRGRISPEELGACGELDLALFELHLALWSRAKERADAKEIERWALESRQLLEMLRPKSLPWWVRRIEILYANMFLDSKSDDNPALLILAIEDAIRMEDSARVMEVCDAAWEKTKDSADEENRVKIALLAASYGFHHVDLPTARDWFRRVSVALPQRQDAIKNHQTAIQIEENIVRKIIDNSVSLELEQNSELANELAFYQTLLLEHLRLFGRNHPELLPVLKKIEHLVRLRGNLRELAEIRSIIVRRLSPDASEYTPEVRSALEAWDELIESIATRDSDEFRKTLQSALVWCDSVGENSLEARFQGILWRLRYQPDSAKALEGALRELLRAPQMASEHRATAQCYLALSLVLQGKGGEVGTLLEQLAPAAEAGQHQALFLTLAKLDEMMARSRDPQSASQFAQITIRLYGVLERSRALDGLEEKERGTLERSLARALLLAGKIDSAIAKYEELAKKYPESREIQTAFGRALAQEAKTRKDATMLNAALEQWRKIEQRSADRSPEWFEAKYEIAALHSAMGNKEIAARLTQSLKMLYPDLGGETWKKKFQELEKNF